jgi:nicotinamidase-related amidase
MMLAIRAALILAALIVLTGLTPSDVTRAQDAPVLPDPQPIVVDPSRTAVLVLDLHGRCNDPTQICSQLISPVGEFLPRARAAGALVIYTISDSARGTALDGPAAGIEAGPDDVMLYPVGFDKFRDGDLDAILTARGIDTVILTGSSSNMAVLYTGSVAARYYNLRVVVPLDGINANTRYEEEFPLHNFMTMSGGANSAFAYTTLRGIQFGSR